jgi:hypothetical protein
MFSELVLLGILCILGELKNNQFFKRRKDEEDNFGCDRNSFVFVD